MMLRLVLVVVLAVGTPTSALRMAAGAKKSKAKKGPAVRKSGGGFGAKPKSAPVVLGRRLEEPQYEALYAWLGEASADLGKVAVADFDGLRGVMATEDIAKGETIVSIPGPCAVDLGTDHFDPVGPAQRLLDAMERDASTRAAYWATLPPADSPDLCTPDFFSESELELLQWPPLVASVNQKSAALRKALGDDADADALRRLRWATWLVLSRVLTVRGPDNAGHKLMIPFVDMFNHKAGVKHYLSGRTDGQLKVVAGEAVAAGEQVFIVYGTETTSAAELLAHYGFVAPGTAAADRQLVMAHADAIPALRATTAQDDAARLAADPPPPLKEELALRFRVALKRARDACVATGLLEEGA